MRLILGFSLIFVAAVALGSTGGGAPEVRAQEGRNFVASLNCTFQVVPETGEVSETNVIASFWIPRRVDLPAATQQVWIDLSLFNNNFARGTFIGAGAFLPEEGTQQFDWFGLRPARRHFYRLNALTPGGWVEVGRGVFDTPDCRSVGQLVCGGGGDQSVLFALHSTPFGDGLPMAREQWIDLSLFNNNFARGSFIGAGPFNAHPAGPFGETFQWNDILPGRMHFFRMNAYYGGTRWVEVARGSFLSLDCRGLPSPAPPPLT
jgi:hypothetical protein